MCAPSSTANSITGALKIAGVAKATISGFTFSRVCCQLVEAISMSKLEAILSTTSCLRAQMAATFTPQYCKALVWPSPAHPAPTIMAFKFWGFILVTSIVF